MPTPPREFAIVTPVHGRYLVRVPESITQGPIRNAPMLVGFHGYGETADTHLERLEAILNLKAAEKPDILDNLSSNWENYVRESPLVKKPDDLMRDGWGNKYKVDVENGVIRVQSTTPAYAEYLKKHKGGGGGT